MATVEQEIRVKIRALVEGLTDVRALAAAHKELQKSAGGQAKLDVAPGSSAGSVRQLSAEIRNLSEQVKNLEPSRLRRFVEVLGNAGNLFRGLAALRQAGVTLTGIQSRLSQIGGAVGARAQAFFSSISAGASNLASRLPGLASGLGASAGGVAALGAAGAAAAGSIAALVAGIGLLAAAVASLAVGLPLVGSLLKRVFDRGIEFNELLEQTELGIASIITTLGELRDGAGRELTGPDKLAAATEVARDQLKKLKVDAILTTAEFEDIAPAFQGAIGPGLAAGLNLDEIRRLTIQITQAAGGLGIPYRELRQETRAILDGTIDQNARLAKTLGISNEMVKKWKEQGKLAEELNKRLDGFTLAGAKAANTMAGLRSNMAEALTVFSGEATTRAFETLKAKYLAILPQIFDFKSAGLRPQFQALAELFDDIFVRVIGIGGEAVQLILDGVKRVGSFAEQNRGQVSEVLALVGHISRQLVGIVATYFRTLAQTVNWQRLLSGVQAALVVISKALEVAAFVAGRLARIFGTAVNLATALSSAVRGVATDIRDVLIPAVIRFLNLIPGLQIAAAALAAARGVAVSATSGPTAGGPFAGGAGTDETAGKSPALPTVTGPKGGAGDDKKKGSKAADQIRQLDVKLREALDALAATRREGLLKNQEAGIEQSFALTRDALERELAAYEENYGLRLVSIRRFFSEKGRIELAAVDAEIRRQQQLSGLAADELAEADRQAREAFERRRLEILADKDLKGKARELALRTAETEKQTTLERNLQQFQEKTARVATEITKLQRERVDLTRQNGDAESEALRRVEESLESVRERLLEERGTTFENVDEFFRIDEAAIKESFREVKESAIREFGAVSDQVREIDKLIQVLVAKARNARQQAIVDRLGESLDLEESRIRDKVLDGLLSERQARASILKLQREYKGVLLDILQAELARARALDLRDEALRIERQIREVERLGLAVDEVGQRLNRSIAGGLTDLVASIGDGFGAAKRAALDFLNTFRREINRLIAEKLVEDLFGPILKPDATNTRGTIGGFIARLLGLKPKETEAEKATNENTDSTKKNTQSVNELIRTLGGTPPNNEDATGGGIFDRILGEFTRKRRVTDKEGGDAEETGGEETGGFFGKVRAGFDSLFGKIKQGISAVGGSLAKVFSAIGSAIASAAGAIAKGVASLFGGGFAEGGEVSGPGTSTSDSILARLSDGEYVVNAASVRRVGLGVMGYINAFGRLPAFAEGGLVGAAPSPDLTLARLAAAGLPQIQAPAPERAGRALKIIFVDDERKAADEASTNDEVFIHKLRRNREEARQILGF